MTLLPIKVKQPCHSEGNDANCLNDPGTKVNGLKKTDVKLMLMYPLLSLWEVQIYMFKELLGGVNF